MSDEIIALPNAVSGRRLAMDTPSGQISFYRSEERTNGGTPLLLIHSINAAGSSFEVRPIYEHFKRDRPVYSVDLPGFGFSERSDRPYTPRLMVNAIHAMVGRIRAECGDQPIDALALSLSSEFLARAASERPDHFRRLAFVSPTGLDSRAPYREADGTTRANPTLYRIFRFPLWDRGFYALLTSRRSIRYFLQRTWGSKNIDESMLDYDYLTTHQPGARFAPYFFVSGYLFSRDITQVYESLPMPVWLSHGIRGDFQDYTDAARFAQRPNWTISKFPTGALPHFEVPADFVRRFAAFLEDRVLEHTELNVNL
jgi:pimeloyl-ACP methyl ester carboxylesterase